ncbi:unnamed protein product [Peronospora belbahrii]|uniref:Uncharacterized protein n=1 Tax=Peronospora belbahrii TaxID=622444 RepID=A0ABN8CYZ7_9STRA|nr:unnamed protein product [Peronospora belbahrii]
MALNRIARIARLACGDQTRASTLSSRQATVLVLARSSPYDVATCHPVMLQTPVGLALFETFCPSRKKTGSPQKKLEFIIKASTRTNASEVSQAIEVDLVAAQTTKLKKHRKSGTEHRRERGFEPIWTTTFSSILPNLNGSLLTLPPLTTSAQRCSWYF